MKLETVTLSKLHEVMESLGMSKEALAVKAKISFATVYKAFNGKPISIRMARLIAPCVKKKVDDLI